MNIKILLMLMLLSPSFMVLFFYYVGKRARKRIENAKKAMLKEQKRAEELQNKLNRFKVEYDNVVQVETRLDPIRLYFDIKVPRYRVNSKANIKRAIAKSLISKMLEDDLIKIKEKSNEKSDNYVIFEGGIVILKPVEK